MSDSALRYRDLRPEEVAEPDRLKTNPVLLLRLREWRDVEAWSVFFKRYRPLILHWCRQAGLDPDTAEDLHQRVQLRVALRMRSFAYDPNRSFRGWLRELVRSQVIDDWRRRRREDSLRFLPGPALDSLADDAEEHEDSTDPLLAKAARVQASVRGRIGEESWRIFWMADIEGIPLAEVARSLGKGYHAAYMTRSRVRKLLIAEGLRGPR